MPAIPLRTITLGLAEAHPLSAATIRRAGDILQSASQRFREAGYEVQTVRLSTRSILDDLAGWSTASLLKYVKELQQKLDEAQLGFCSLGTAQVAAPGFPLKRLEGLADLLIATQALNLTVQLATPEQGVRTEAALPTAHIIKRLAEETEEGFGNFRFAMLACVAPGSPFFPAAYHVGASSLSIGLQGAGIVAQALKPQQSSYLEVPDLELVTYRMREALRDYATPIVALGRELAQEHDLLFGGIDLSPAPMGEDSIVTAIEQCGQGKLGSAGTLAVAAALTAACKSTGLPTCGYCGLMLPVLEDVGLARRWEEGQVNAHQLLLYSAVCGTGLDTIPMPGDCQVETIANLLLDVASLAQRLRKPLSARLFPVPGKRAGEYTAFTSPYLTNTLIQSI
ncbi:DUF711 family protein [Ktedonosporobacter rubrisoli]|uniref:DUF711 family protein n=1 Tax=Ktedonosporobacter rubrisoli TaxID=2509675 RepID=A0A4P6JVU9_KTERU|nr:DUF711 family protein [Ktedonosporobacter rubrisoli]QBD79106.1 DUF711 family protein [Ktedonosporobacter rubrisoli]